MTGPCPRRCGYMLRSLLDECPNPGCQRADLNRELAYERALEDDR